ncbi:hypothetical protein [Apibacter sp. HY039]|uniref:hypothetical protein n=1 Tax=Apibacter sp. HY039 TaxID=2501476 RepID=UPI000FEB766F|nr:hypothetical protein [Apibacter sp. HY039]
MKKIVSSAIFCCMFLICYSQVGLGTESPDSNSVLTIEGNKDESNNPSEDFVMRFTGIKVTQYDATKQHYLLGLDEIQQSGTFPLTVFNSVTNHYAIPPCTNCVSVPHFGWQNANASLGATPSYYGVNTHGLLGWTWPNSASQANSSPSFGASYTYQSGFTYPNATLYYMRGQGSNTTWNDFFSETFTLKTTTDVFITFNLANNVYATNPGVMDVIRNAPCTKYAAVLADNLGNLYNKNGEVITGGNTVPHTGIMAQFTRLASMTSGSGFSTGVVKNVPPGTYRVLLLYGNGCTNETYLGSTNINTNYDEHGYSYNISVYYDDFSK